MINSGKTSIFATLTDLCIYSQFTKAFEILRWLGTLKNEKKIIFLKVTILEDITSMLSLKILIMLK